MEKSSGQTPILKSIKNTLTFGDQGAKNFHQVDDTGDKIIILRGGKNFDSLQIGNVKYGGDGGREYARAKLPPTGIFRLLEVRGRDCITYFKAEIGGEMVEVGGEGDDKKIVLELDLQVRFSGVYAGSRVDKIIFEVISQNNK